MQRRAPIRSRAEIPVAPKAPAWVTDDLVRYTQDVWSEVAGKPIPEDEAIEILVNVKRLAEVLVEIKADNDAPPVD